MMTVSELRPGTAFRVPIAGFEAHLVKLSAGAAVVEVERSEREFIAHDTEGEKAVRIAGGKRRTTISLATCVEVIEP